MSPGIGLELSDALSGAAYFKVPLYQNVHGIPQAAPFNLSFSLFYTFDVVGTE